MSDDDDGDDEDMSLLDYIERAVELIGEYHQETDAAEKRTTMAALLACLYGAHWLIDGTYPDKRPDLGPKPEAAQLTKETDEAKE